MTATGYQWIQKTTVPLLIDSSHGEELETKITVKRVSDCDSESKRSAMWIGWTISYIIWIKAGIKLNSFDLFEDLWIIFFLSSSLKIPNLGNETIMSERCKRKNRVLFPFIHFAFCGLLQLRPPESGFAGARESLFLHFQWLSFSRIIHQKLRVIGIFRTNTIYCITETYTLYHTWSGCFWVGNKFAYKNSEMRSNKNK